MTLPARAPAFAAWAAVALGVALCWRIVPYRLDDAYITYRYAANLAAGHGFVFNPGGEPVEGFTSPLWCLLLALPAVLGSGSWLPELSTVLGASSCLGAIWVVWRAGRRGFAGAVSVVSLAVLPGAAFYAVTGMEACLFLLVVVTFAAAMAEVVPLRWGLVAGVVAVWVRPEGAWLPVMALAQVLGAGTPGRLLTRSAWLLVGAIIASGATLLGARLLVFGEVLPNTYFAKEASAAIGLGYLRLQLLEPAGAALVLLGMAGALLGEPRHRGYVAGAVAWMVAVVLEGGDWMPAGRFLLPVWGLMALGAGGVASARVRGAPRAAWLVAGGVLVSAALSVAGTLAESQRAAWSEHHIRGEARFIADWVGRSGATSVAAVDIGLLGFLTGADVTDLGGLTDARIGRRAGRHLHKPLDLDYVVAERHPEVVIIRLGRPPARDPGGSVRLHGLTGVERQLMGAPEFAMQYRLLFSVLPEDPQRNPYYGRAVFARRGFYPSLDAAVATDVVHVP